MYGIAFTTHSFGYLRRNPSPLGYLSVTLVGARDRWIGSKKKTRTVWLNRLLGLRSLALDAQLVLGVSPKALAGKKQMSLGASLSTPSISVLSMLNCTESSPVLTRVLYILTY
eukprot:scaffold119746_cov69-Phaeocystis_antarctica.AAC.2